MAKKSTKSKKKSTKKKKKSKKTKGLKVPRASFSDKVKKGCLYFNPKESSLFYVDDDGNLFIVNKSAENKIRIAIQEK